MPISSATLGNAASASARVRYTQPLSSKAYSSGKPPHQYELVLHLLPMRSKVK